MGVESVLHPSLIVPVGHVEPVPRRVRGFVDGHVVFDTRRALYVWEWAAIRSTACRGTTWSRRG